MEEYAGSSLGCVATTSGYCNPSLPTTYTGPITAPYNGEYYATGLYAQGYGGTGS